jgi:membrane associated rhomboid family serine protease
MKLAPLDPMRTRATDNGPVDGKRGAYIGFRIRERRRREMLRVAAEVDIGEPGRPVVTMVFLAATILATAVEFGTFGAAPTTSELARAGGAGIGTLATGATWKLLTANLLHANLPHVLMNAFILFLTGRWLEHLVGRWLVAATICWAALLTNVGALFIDVPTVGIGASGVAFGLLGCAIAADPRARTATGVIALQLAVVNVIATFLVPGISIGGHFGGLVAGLLVGWLGFSRRTSEECPAGRSRRVVALLAIAAALPCIVVLALGPARVPGHAREFRSDVLGPLLSRQLAGAKLNTGLKIEEADCRQVGPDDLDYVCALDHDRDALVRFSERDDQWSLRLAE